jgi:ankyrin repeat protein
MTPLLLACKAGPLRIVELLIDHVDIKEAFILNIASPDLYPLHLLLRQKTESVELVRRILGKIRQVSLSDLNEQLARIDNTRQSLLQIAIENNHLQTTRMLLGDYYVRDELREDKNGNLPVHWVARMSANADMFTVLIECGAFSLATNGNYENALHIAATANRFKFITEFLAHERKLVAEKKDPEFLKGMFEKYKFNHKGS